ncbi:AfsA-related hotdog domain-containing protein [Actinacidiphila yeochonensis]|uniref:AfsA-related hotdog domain-containing protein n=1 Tax=Actinacidiphila yeochonensis TaxID=89050 RepID=UPI00068ED4EC|nr:AfsA-related hotdog domain-containing protein [Actinacidiphila yeochonensis]
MSAYEAAAPEAPRIRLTHEQTVPRAIAHRRAVGEVFVTDSAAVSDDEFLLAWQIPRAHALWGDRLAPFHDPFAVAEAARQGSFVVVHRHLDIPLDLPFSLQRFAFQVHDLAAFRDDRSWPLQGLLRYRISDRRTRGGDLGSMTLHGEVEIGGAVVMEVGGDVVFLSRADYRALREFQRSRKPLAAEADRSPAEPLPPALVGRADVRNVVVGEPEPLRFPAGLLRYPLVVDRTHPSYFDHDYDHVPGPFVVEGFRQAALLAAGRDGALASPVAAMTGLETTFADFGEFEAPLHYSAEVQPRQEGEPRVHVQVGLHQFGAELAQGRIELTPYTDC